MTVWIYIRGDEIMVFATAEAAQAWFDKNDPEGVAFEYPVFLIEPVPRCQDLSCGGNVG